VRFVAFNRGGARGAVRGALLDGAAHGACRHLWRHAPGMHGPPLLAPRRHPAAAVHASLAPRAPSSMPLPPNRRRPLRNDAHGVAIAPHACVLVW
jgi:hypothetical protein